MPTIPGFLVPRWHDLIEIVLVAAVVYRLLRFLVCTRALPIVFGLLVLLVIYLLPFVFRSTIIPSTLGVSCQ